MKLAIMLLTVTCLQLRAESFAQKITLHKSNTSIEKIFETIYEQAGYQFVCTKDMLREAKKVSIDVDNASLIGVLKICFKDQPLTYSLRDKAIIVRRKGEPDNELRQLIAPIQVTGKVTDSLGNPLIGVTIKSKTGTAGTVTDGSGNYSITVPDDAVLVVSYVGFMSKEVAVNGHTQIDVTLQPAMTALNQLVVTALGVKQEARALTYSAQSVNVEDITKNRSDNVLNTLKGKVPGMAINTAGTGLGASVRVVLRGNRSISGSSEPLYVVDGVPILGDLSLISPDDIASITVLKGASAAALYGSRGQNGAVIIETKTGAAGQPKVSVSTNLTVSTPIFTIPFQYEYGQGSAGQYIGSSELAWGPKMEGQMVDTWSLDPKDAGNQYALNPQTNNRKDILQTGMNSSSNVFASFGDKNARTIVAYTYTYGQGVVPENTLKRHNFTIRVNDNLFNGALRLDAKLNYIKQDIHNEISTGESSFNPYRQIYNLPPNIRTVDAKNFEYINAEGVPTQNYWYPSTTVGSNPYWAIYRNPRDNGEERIIGMTSLTYKFSDLFNLMVRGSFDRINSTSDVKYFYGTYRQPVGRYEVGKSSSDMLYGDFLFNYKQDLSKNWHVDANLGGSLRKSNNDGLSTSTGSQMLIPNFFSIANTLLPTAGYSHGSSTEVQSLYAFGTISWKNALFLNIAGRNDWSSTLPPDSWSFFYPSAGLSAIISDLIPNFPQKISHLKLRFSYANVGNATQPYMLTRTAGFTAGGNNGFLQLSSTLPNKELEPEKTVSYEGGVDIGLWDERLGLGVTLYRTNTFNQLFTIALPVGSGASQFYTNGGDVQNEGLEILLTSTPIRTNNVTWNVNVNFSTYKSLVKEISDERPRIVVGSDSYVREYVVEQGKPFGEVFSRGFLRDDQGRVIVDANGIPETTSGRTVPVANFKPDWIGSISSDFSYKNFNLNLLIDHRHGGTSVSMTRAILDGNGFTKRTLQGREGGLVFGQNIFPNYTAVQEDGHPNDVAVSAEQLWTLIGGRNSPVGEAFVDDLTNTRLRELSIGYTIPNSVFGSSSHISNVNISLVGRNLFFFYRASPYVDPDVLTGTGTIDEGFQSFTPPSVRSFGINIKADLK